ncbi:MAG: hypothetical protein ACRCUT_12120, partial [Spirochaetota bacterium]
MKKIFFAAFSLIAVLYSANAEASRTVTAEKIYSDNDVKAYNFTVAINEAVNSRQLFVINGGCPDPKKIIWIFPGYKPKGDPYSQSPRVFIEKWKMVQLCKENNFICIVPDMGTSVYPVTGMEDEYRISDMRWLKEAYQYFVFAPFKARPVVIAGVSTGVEGAVKFSSEIQNVESVVGVSGTYNFFSIPRESGEYQLHQRVFGDDPKIWRNENPVEILRRSVRTRLYLFCESQSMYSAQAD